MQAPKGGVTIAGVFYKGGQFILWDAPAYTSSPDEPTCIEYDLFDLLNQIERKEG